jgi:hypothetical protein
MVSTSSTLVCSKNNYSFQYKIQGRALWIIFDLQIKQHPGSSCMWAYGKRSVFTSAAQKNLPHANRIYTKHTLNKIPIQ